jgi:tetratricopeptide (TPR) repeat protein
MTTNSLGLKKNTENGLAQYQAGNYPAALDAFSTAKDAYLTNGDLLAAAEMQNNICLVQLKLGDPQAGWAAVAKTDEVFSKAGDLRRQALALGNQAAALDALGKREQAVEKYQACSDLLKQVGDKENRAAVLQSLSQLQLRMGRQLEAMATMQIALDNKPKLSFKERFLDKLLKVPFRFFNH